MNSGLQFVVRHVQDIDAARAFYIEKMGLAVEVEQPGFVQFKAPDGAPFAISLASADPVAAALPGGQSESLELWWYVDDADAVCAELQSRGVEIVFPPKECHSGAPSPSKMRQAAYSSSSSRHGSAECVFHRPFPLWGRGARGEITSGCANRPVIARCAAPRVSAVRPVGFDFAQTLRFVGASRQWRAAEHREQHATQGCDDSADASGFTVRSVGDIEQQRLAYTLATAAPLAAELERATIDRIRFFLSLDDNLERCSMR